MPKIPVCLRRCSWKFTPRIRSLIESNQDKCLTKYPDDGPSYDDDEIFFQEEMFHSQPNRSSVHLKTSPMFHRQKSRNKQVLALFVPPFFRLCCIFSGIVFLPFWLFSRWSAGPSPIVKSFSKNGLVSGRLHSKKQRLAIIIPFIGEGPEAVPPYLELFCTAAGGSASLVDFLLIHDGVLDGYYGAPCPENVIFISLSSLEEFSRYMVRVVDHKPERDIALGQSRERLAKIVATHIIKYPYVLVEFKPALGHIFAEFLKGYSHWGYSDLDILFGDLERWITPDELNDFDIVTYGFGDQDRIYLRGQFTFHKNEEKINQLWRSCHYLSDMDQRFNDVLTGAKVIPFVIGCAVYIHSLQYRAQCFLFDVISSIGCFYSTFTFSQLRVATRQQYWSTKT